MKRKICAVITARPSYSRIRTALEAISKHDGLELVLVVSASAMLYKYGKVIDIIREDGYGSIETVFNLVEGENLLTSVKTTALGMIELASIFARIKPDVVLTVADRYETIATAIAASYMNIPLAHIQGGEVTGNIDEKVRHAVTKFADIHFVATEKAKERVIRMGENPEKVFVTGCPSIDIVKRTLNEKGSAKFDLFSKYAGVGNLLANRDDYIIVLQHPVTAEIDAAKDHLFHTYNAVKDIPMQIYWLWPNVDAGSDIISKSIRHIRESESPPNIYFLKNLTPDDFILFLNGSKCIVGNSSVAIREASFMGVPAVNIGTRQAGRERGFNVVDVPYDSTRIKKAINDALGHRGKLTTDALYGDGSAGQAITDIIAEVDLTFEKRLHY